MIEFFLFRSLWNKLKPELKGVLKDKYSIVGRQFKGMLSSTINDLVLVLKENLKGGIHGKYAQATIKRNDKIVLRVLAIPLTSVNKSVSLKEGLSKQILKNLHLDALRNSLKVSDLEWKDIIDGYSMNILLLGLPIAIKKMVENEDKLYDYGYSEYYVVDLVEGEAFRINGQADFHDLIIVYEKVKEGIKVSKARSIWKDRLNSKYNYEIDNYIDYKML